MWPQPLTQEPGPLFCQRSAAGAQLLARRPAPHVSRIVSTLLRPGQDASPPPRPPGTRPSPPRAPAPLPPPPVPSPPPLLPADSALFPSGPTLRRNFFSALFWDVSPWKGGAGPGRRRSEPRGRVAGTPASGAAGVRSPLRHGLGSRGRGPRGCLFPCFPPGGAERGGEWKGAPRMGHLGRSRRPHSPGAEGPRPAFPCGLRFPAAVGSQGGAGRGERAW